MPEVKLKVCGLRDNAKEVLEEVRPDFAGFIFYDKSPRYAGASTSFSLPNGTKKVGVFVNENYENIMAKIKSHDLAVVQLHGDETPELCLRLRAHVEVIKVFAGNRAINKAQLKSYEPFVDYFLFDTKGKTFGGTGISFDWEKLKNLPIAKPIILSGGIGLKEAKQIRQLKGLNIYAIDVNSRFEVAPGLKEVKMLKKLKQLL